MARFSSSVPPPLSRRRFLQSLAIGAGALALRSSLARARQDAERGLVRRTPPKRVLIIGGGLAGLVAGFELKRAGHDVTVLEATLRPGGRVRTLREPFSDGLYAEAGAGRIPSTNTLTLDYVARFRLKLVPYRPRAPEVSLLGGVRQIRQPGRDVDLSKVALDLSPAERQLGLDGLYARYLAPHAREVGAAPAESWPPAAFAPLGELTIEEFLRAKGASDAAIRLLVAGFEHDSALDFLRDAWSHEAPVLTKIVGGNDLLPRAFAGALAAQIVYGAPVEAVEQDERGVRAQCMRAGERRTFAADRIICTVPFAALRGVAFSPALSPGKRRAIEELGYGSVTRVYLQTRRRFWADEGVSGFATVDDPMEIWAPTHDQPGERGILLGYLYEALARRVASLGPAERVTFLLESLAPVYPALREHFEGGTSFVWHEQPYQRGAFSMCTKGQFAALWPHVSPREGRIHFAGEHASPWPGWMQGALYSGLRAAREVNDA
jgi:monoamine oxidase